MAERAEGGCSCATSLHTHSRTHTTRAIPRASRYANDVSPNAARAAPRLWCWARPAIGPAPLGRQLRRRRRRRLVIAHGCRSLCARSPTQAPHARFIAQLVRRDRCGCGVVSGRARDGIFTCARVPLFLWLALSFTYMHIHISLHSACAFACVHAAPSGDIRLSRVRRVHACQHHQGTRRRSRTLRDTALHQILRGPLYIKYT